VMGAPGVYGECRKDDPHDGVGDFGDSTCVGAKEYVVEDEGED
jgi:hypothetical protein